MPNNSFRNFFLIMLIPIVSIIAASLIGPVAPLFAILANTVAAAVWALVSAFLKRNSTHQG